MQEISNNLETQEFRLNMGPQHPSTHGVYRASIVIDGEKIIELQNHIGYLHRGIEKLAEARTYTQFIPYTDRLDYLSSLLNNLAYVQTIEKLMKVEVPERAEYIRVIMAELQRIASHLVYLASMSIDLNAVTGWMFAFTAREKFLDIFEMVAGSRMMASYMRVGGVTRDLPDGFSVAINGLLDEIPKRIDEFESFISKNSIFIGRTKGIAPLDKATCYEYGVTGPNIRASGIKFDLRKNAPYGIYDRFDFKIPVLENGDCYDRFNIRIHEIRESLKIVKQAFKDIPEGPVMAKVPRVLKPEPGETYHQIESSKGILGFYIVSDGNKNPYRLHIHSPSFVNIGILPKLAVGMNIQDFIALLASIDFVLGDVDR
jgi:NADH-quinone oxidoreductase subunit D